MREANAFRIGIVAACVLAAGVPAAFAQSYAESGVRSRVAIPYNCAHDPASGRLRLTPSPEQVYEIVDRLDTRRATVCNPGGTCSTWLLHRFQMKCGAHRVPWMNVVAAALATKPGPRATIEQGRLVLTRSLPTPGGPRGNCFDRLSGTAVPSRVHANSGLDDCWESPRPVYASARHWRISMPPGFAPARLMSARVIMAPREEIAASPSSEPAPSPEARSVPTSAEPAPEPKHEERPGPPKAEPITVPVASVAQTGPTPAPASPAPPPPAEKAREEQAPARIAFVVPPPAQADVPAQAVQASGKAGEMARSPGPISLPALADEMGAVSYWIAGSMVLGLVLLVWLARRRGRRADQELPTGRAVSFSTARMQGPDVAAVEQLAAAATERLIHCRACLDRLPPSLPLRQVIARELHASVERLDKLAAEPCGTAEEVRRIRLRLQAITRELQRLSAIADGALSSIGGNALVPVEMVEPRDRSEAYAVLGVNPDVEPRVLKKLVDALRQSWHPDQARDEADRRRREDRIKQINVAWDIIQGKRVEA